jgi:protoheme ferro-lyase
MGGEEEFKHSGGQEFTLIPCVNENHNWVLGFGNFIKSNYPT